MGRMSDTECTIRELLLSIASKHSYDKCKIHLKPIDTHGANFSSKLYEATISAADKPDVELFAKVGIIGKGTRTAVNVEIYTREFIFYDEIFEVYKSIEEKYNIPAQHRLCIAKYYGCNKEYLKEAIVLENLLKKKFVCYDRFKSVDWDYASRCIKQLAVLHSCSIAYAHEYPEKFAEVAKSLEIDYPKVLFEKAVENAIDVANESYKERFSIFLKDYLKDEKFRKFFMPGNITVLIHGDFRPSNLMHRMMESGELEIAVLDFQTIQTGNPALDLLYYIISGSDEKFRLHHFDRIIQHYYRELCSSLRRYNLDPNEVYPKQNFEDDFEKVLPFGLLIAILVLPFVTIAPENIPTVDDIFGQKNLGLKTSDLFAERLNGVIRDYIKIGLL